MFTATLRQIDSPFAAKRRGFTMFAKDEWHVVVSETDVKFLLLNIVSNEALGILV